MRALVDTSALLALANTRDQYHVRAGRAAQAHRRNGGRFISTLAVLVEFQTHLLYLRGPAAARDATQALLADSLYEWLPVTPDLVGHAVTGWLARFADQRLSLTDAISFEVMRRERVKHAFAFDQHFEIAGFTLMT